MKRRICLFLLLALNISFVYPQNEKEAQSLVKTIANKINPKQGVQATFTASNMNNKGASMSGVISFKNNKYYLHTKKLRVWFDGQTQWTYNPESSEVNVSIPTQEEQQAVNPYAFLNFNPQLYFYSIVKKTTTHTTLRMQDKGRKKTDIQVKMNNTTKLPESISLKQGSTWVNITIKSLKNKMKWGDSYFRFDKNKYPNVEIIDLR